MTSRPHAYVTDPFTADQVASMNGYQASGTGHEFTCGYDPCRRGTTDPRSLYAPLRATQSGWRCDWCGYTQNWAFEFMTDRSWQSPGPWALIVFSGTHGDI
jgi:hypothetical protein